MQVKSDFVSFSLELGDVTDEIGKIAAPEVKEEHEEHEETEMRRDGMLYYL